MTWIQSNNFAEIVRMGATAGVIVLVIIRALMLRARWRRGAHIILAGLIVLATVSAGAFIRFGAYPWVGGYNSHEFFHYYLGPKYYREVGYEHLYPSAVVADLESDQRFRQVKKIRDVNTQRQIPRLSVIPEAPAYVAQFTAVRWAEFKSDVGALVSDNRLRGHLITDLGFVASPFWTSVVSPLLQYIPAASERALSLLSMVDYVLLLMALGTIWRVYGLMTALVTAISLFTTFAIASWTVRGSILRWDWLAALIGSLCCLRAGWLKVGGFLAAFAVLVRGFPILFFLGPASQAAWSIIRYRRLPDLHRTFFASMFISALILIVPSLVTPGGMERWKEFLSRMSQHSELIRVRRVGMTAAATYAGESSHGDFVTEDAQKGREAWSAEKQSSLESVRPFLRALSVLVLIIVGVLSLRLAPDVSMALGTLALFFTFDVSWYYYVVLCIPVIVFAAHLGHIAGSMGTMVLAAGNLACLFLEKSVEFELRRYAFVSWVLMAVIIISAWLLHKLNWKRAREVSLVSRS